MTTLLLISWVALIFISYKAALIALNKTDLY